MKYLGAEHYLENFYLPERVEESRLINFWSNYAHHGVLFAARAAQTYWTAGMFILDSESC